jgi:hypothetical protein
MNKEQELLVVLTEECGEVIQASSKILRFGLNSKNPYSNKNNKEQLEQELGDLMCLIRALTENGTIDLDSVLAAAEKKRKKLEKYLKNQ